MKLDKFAFLRGRAIFALLCVVALTPNALFAEKTTNTYTKVANAESISWANAGLPDSVKTTDGSDISIKVDYAEGYEKYQQLKTAETAKKAVVPLYLDSVIGGKYHDISFVNPENKCLKYAVINDPTPFEGFWSIDAGPARASGIFLPDNGGA